jgi:hypothetical protein
MNETDHLDNLDIDRNRRTVMKCDTLPQPILKEDAGEHQQGTN